MEGLEDLRQTFNENIYIIISFKHMTNKLKSASLKLFININNSDSNSTTVKQYYAFAKDFLKWSSHSS